MSLYKSGRNFSFDIIGLQAKKPLKYWHGLGIKRINGTPLLTYTAEDIDTEVKQELQKKAIIEEHVVVRKEVPVEEYEQHMMRTGQETHIQRQESPRRYLETGTQKQSYVQRGTAGAVTSHRASAVDGGSILGRAMARQSSPARATTTFSPARTSTYAHGGTTYAG